MKLGASFRFSSIRNQIDWTHTEEQESRKAEAKTKIYMLSILFLRARMTLGGFIPFSVRSAIESKSLTAFKFRENLKNPNSPWSIYF